MIAMKRLQSHFTYFEYPLKFISHFRIKIHSNPALTFISNNFPMGVQLEKSSSEYSKFRKFNSQRKCTPHRTTITIVRSFRIDLMGTKSWSKRERDREFSVKRITIAVTQNRYGYLTNNAICHASISIADKKRERGRGGGGEKEREGGRESESTRGVKVIPGRLETASSPGVTTC